MDTFFIHFTVPLSGADIFCTFDFSQQVTKWTKLYILNLKLIESWIGLHKNRTSWILDSIPLEQNFPNLEKNDYMPNFQYFAELRTFVESVVQNIKSYLKTIPQRASTDWICVKKFLLCIVSSQGIIKVDQMKNKKNKSFMGLGFHILKIWWILSHFTRSFYQA